MARINNDLLYGASGKFGKDTIYKTRNHKTFASKAPKKKSTSNTPEQKHYRTSFANAVAYAQSINNDPDRKAAYKVKKGATVYNTAVSEYLQLQKNLSKTDLNERQIKAVMFAKLNGSLRNKEYQHLNNISKPTATRDLKVLVEKSILSFTGKGAGATYQIIGSSIHPKRQ